MRSSLRLKRGVIVQASVFGMNNRAVLEALAEDKSNLRGVAVVDRLVSDATLEQWHLSGIRGLRFITSGLGGTRGVDDLVALAPRIAPLGWHVEIQAAVNQWADLFPILRQLSVPLVIDHMGTISAEVDLNHESIRVVHHLVRDSGAYVKLIGYRLSPDPADPRLIRRAHQLYEAAPDRMLWGSDWPHVMHSPMVDAGELLNGFARWFANDRGVMNNILERNPMQLFGF